MRLIRGDIPRTFSNRSSAVVTDELSQKDVPLLHLLQAYACYASDTSYVQGMNFIAATFLHVGFPPVDAFSCLPATFRFFLADLHQLDGITLEWFGLLGLSGLLQLLG